MHSAGEETYQETRQVEQGNFATAGQISASFKNTLKKLGVASPVIRRIAIASYEAEINLAIHSWGGTMRLVIYPNRVRLRVAYGGPGIADIDLSMQEGDSTASGEVRRLGFGAGMGMPNMKRCADGFQIASQVGKGTSICMEFNL